MNPTSSAFTSFDNEAVTHTLQRSPQNPLSFACNFCLGLTFASDFFPSYAHTVNTLDYLAAAGRSGKAKSNGVGSTKSWLARLGTFAVRV